MDRGRWKKLLAEAPPRDGKTAYEFGALLVEWTEEKVRQWYGARLHRDFALREELGEVASKFLASVAKANFACLARVPLEKREAYLCQILRRCVARHFARERELREHYSLLADCCLGAEDEEYERDTDDCASTDAGPEEIALRHALWEEALAVVATMPPRRQDVFHDRYEEWMTERETAEHLQIPLGTVKWHDREILIRLKRHFGASGS